MSAVTLWCPRAYQIALELHTESHIVIKAMRDLGYPVRSPSTRVELMPTEYEALKACVLGTMTLADLVRRDRNMRRKLDAHPEDTPNPFAPA